HGGGFYHHNKYLVAPQNLPDKLHWSYWESYSTWLTGFALLTVLYFFNASSFLVDRNIFDWSPGAAVAGALAYLALGWIVYDVICRVFGRDAKGDVGGDLKVGVLVFIYSCVATWVACRLFSGRAAFLLTGAMIATIMSANVLMVIIPGQRKVVAALRAGRPVDPNHGRRGKQRSVHNTYFTLPVLVAMLTNHYAMTYQHPLNWLVLVLLMLAGALIRLFFVLRHKGPARWELIAAGVALIGIVVWLVAPEFEAATAVPDKVGFAQVQPIIEQRCVPCHSAAVINKGVSLHTAQAIAKHAQALFQQTVVLKTMPLGNATQMLEVERALLKRWFEGGAPVQ
ncbi:MAG: urate hydroxylase PuuD, partial [Burkholderiaceae bacterium]